MKHKAIKLAVASALTVGVASQAHAVFFEPWTLTGTETHTIRLGGATAQDQGIVLLMRRLCAADTMVRVQGVSQSAVLCEANGTDSAPIAAGTKLVMYKNSASGSGSGVNPVADGVTLPFVNLASLSQTQYTNASICTLTSVASTADFVNYKNYACGANLANANAVPDGGISDVEPRLLGWISGTNGALDVFAGPQVIFGVPVSKNFRDALQTAQGKTSGSDTEADMPSLTKGQIASMLNGGLIPLSRLSGVNGVQLAPPAGATTVQICRRKAGSGTLASYNAYFLGVGCTSGVAQMTVGIDGDAVIPAVNSRVQEYGGTGQVIGCLNAHHAANKYAIGMAGMENVPGSAYANTGRPAPFDNDTSNWRWIKIQGYAPTLLNTVQAKYDFAYEATWQHRAAGNPAGGLTGDRKTFFDRIVATNGASTVIRELNVAFTQTFGDSGLLGKPGVPTAPSAAPAGPLTAAEVRANPVNTWTRAATGTPNSCQPPYILFETGLDMLM